MIAGGIQYIYDGYWWEIYPAGVAIILAVVAFTLLGDGMRDGFDPQSRIRLPAKLVKLAGAAGPGG